MKQGIMINTRSLNQVLIHMQPISKLNSRHKLAKSQLKKEINKLPRIPIPKNKHNCKKKISRSSATNPEYLDQSRAQRIGEKTSISQGRESGRYWPLGHRSRRKGRHDDAGEQRELYKQLGIENNKQIGYWANIQDLSRIQTNRYAVCGYLRLI